MENKHQCGGCGSGCGSSDDGSKGCGCNKKNAKTMTIVENGIEILCNVVELIEYEDKKYIALQDKDTDRIYLYNYSEVEDDVVLNPITDNRELRQIGRLLIELIE